MTQIRKYAAAVAIAAAVGASSASATIIMTFSQQGGVNVVTGTTNAGQTATTLSIVNAGVSFGFVQNGPAILTGTLNLSGTCSGATVAGGILTEHCTGNFAFTSGATNVLTGTFVDLLTGNIGEHSLTLQASTPPPTDVTFTSSVITTLGLERAIAFSFTNHLGAPGTPAGVTLCGTTICSFTSAVSGNASAELPITQRDPATLGLLGLALAVLGFVRRRTQA